MDALREAHGADVRFIGVGGAEMIVRGLESITSMDVFAVNGFVEPIRRLPRLLGAFRMLRARFLAEHVAVFVGVDFNVFNLILERSLKRRGVRTVHYVSPSVYAWRRGRTRRIDRAVDAVMTLFPFEPPLYESYGVRAEFVGHPLADAIEPREHRMPARAALGIHPTQLVLALLPGSRTTELDLHAELFLRAAIELRRKYPGLLVLVAVVNDSHEAWMQARAVAVDSTLEVRVLRGRSRDVIAAADVALIKSGTGTLEAMLLGTPMVVSYRLPALSYRIVKALLRTPYVALPNILAGRELVPELLQDAATPPRLAAALDTQLTVARSDGLLRAEFRAIHSTLRRGASERAARVVLSVAGH